MTVDEVVRISIEGAALAAGVGLLCRLVPRLRSGHRAILWWLVSAKLLVGLVPLPALTVAALPAATNLAVPAEIAPGGPAPAPAPTAPAVVSRVSPGRAALWIWFVGGALLSLAAIPDGLRVRRFIRAGRIVGDDASRLAIERARCAAGLRRAPRVFAVPGLKTPLVTGLFRPAVLLPALDVKRLEPAELEMALAHEMAHVARGDLWLGLVPAFARRLFFFHPAAWIAEREYAIAREAACDEAVLSHRGADAFAYGQLLLRLAMRRPLRSAIPMSPQSMLRRRLEMIETMMRRVPLGRAGWALVAVAALSIVPVRLVARESGKGRCLDMGSGRDDAYVITDGRRHSMCGDTGDVRFADAQRRNDEDIVWFRVDDQDWVVRDPAVVAEARRLFSGVSKAGEQQAEIGAVQSRLGMEQSRIGFAEGTGGFERAAAAQRKAEIAFEKASEDLRRAGRAEAADTGTDEAVRSRQAELERVDAALEAELERSREVDATVEAAGARTDELSARMAALSKEMAALGEKQRLLGETMSRQLAEARRALSELLLRAMHDGTAERSL